MAGHHPTFKSLRSIPGNPGIDEVEPNEVWENRNEVFIVDVRQADEFTGELGHIPGSRLIVLDSLPQRLHELPTDKTVVFVCRSGGRSARATAFARGQGLRHALNMRGGMLLWNELNLQVEGRSE